MSGLSLVPVLKLPQLDQSHHDNLKDIKDHDCHSQAYNGSKDPMLCLLVQEFHTPANRNVEAEADEYARRTIRQQGHRKEDEPMHLPAQLVMVF